VEQVNEIVTSLEKQKQVTSQKKAKNNSCMWEKNNVHLTFLLKNHRKYHLLSSILCPQNLILRKDDVDIHDITILLQPCVVNLVTFLLYCC
jgi:hypothetical protein